MSFLKKNVPGLFFIYFFGLYFSVDLSNVSWYIRNDINVMVNFKPGKYMRKMFYSVNDTADSEKKIRVLLATIPDALPLSYRRLVGAKAIKLGSGDKRPAYC